MFHAFVFSGIEVASTSIEKDICVLEFARSLSNKTAQSSTTAYFQPTFP